MEQVLAEENSQGNSTEKIDENVFVKVVLTAFKLIRGLAIVTTVIGLVVLIFGLGVSTYLYFFADYGYWLWICYSLVLGVPTLIGLFFSYSFYNVSEMPAALEELTTRLKEKFPKYRKGFKLKKYGGGKKIKLSLQLCWDAFMVSGNVDDIVSASALVGLAFTPVGWIILLVNSVWAILGFLVMSGLLGWWYFM